MPFSLLQWSTTLGVTTTLPVVDHASHVRVDGENKSVSSLDQYPLKKYSLGFYKGSHCYEKRIDPANQLLKRYVLFFQSWYIDPHAHELHSDTTRVYFCTSP